MRCKHCNAQIKNHELYCHKCMKKTQITKDKLSATLNFKESFQNYKQQKNKSMKVNITYTFIMITFISVLILHYFTFSANYPNDTVRYLVENLIYLFFVPMLLIPFGFQDVKMEVGFGKELLSHSIKLYPKYLIFTAINIAIFAFFKFICIGDPILRLVRVVLVLWWLSVQLPIPVLITRYKMSFYKLFRLSIKAFEDVRWQMFTTWILALLMNIVLVIPVFIGHVMYGPFIYTLVHRYVEKVEACGIIDNYLETEKK